MDLVQLIRLAITASILLLVFALGLRATAEDATYVLRRPALLLRGFVAMGVIVPAVAAALAALFQLNPAVEIAVLAMAVSPVPPILPGKQLKLGGRSRYVFGLLVAAALVAVIFVPLAIELLGWLWDVIAEPVLRTPTNLERITRGRARDGRTKHGRIACRRRRRTADRLLRAELPVGRTGGRTCAAAW